MTVTSPKPWALLLALLLLLPTLTGCDSEATLGLDAEYFHGNWRLDEVRDGNGDRTAEVEAVVDELRVTFHADDSFALRVVYVSPEIPDNLLDGTYSVSPTGQLILTVGDFAAPFNASIQSENRVELRAPAPIVAAIIAVSGVDLQFVGTVVLTLARGGPGA